MKKLIAALILATSFAALAEEPAKPATEKKSEKKAADKKSPEKTDATKPAAEKTPAPAPEKK
jgi:hypothetical protein